MSQSRDLTRNRKKVRTAVKPSKSSTQQYDAFGRRGWRLRFIAEELVHLYEHYEKYESEKMKSSFNHMVRYLLDLYFAPNKKLNGAGLISRKARKAILKGNVAETQSDHVVPMKELQKAFNEITKRGSSESSIRKMEDFIYRNVFVVRITNDEHKTLNAKGHKAGMPTNWKDRDSPWQRYIQAGINEVFRKDGTIVDLGKPLALA